MKDTLQFLTTREIPHMKAFTAAPESMGKDRFTIGQISLSKDVVNMYFNDSTGEGDLGQGRNRPWNIGSEWKMEDGLDLRVGVYPTTLVSPLPD